MEPVTEEDCASVVKVLKTVKIEIETS